MKIRWDTVYDVVYIVTGGAKSGSFKLIRFGGFGTGQLFFYDGDLAFPTCILIPLHQVEYARVAAT